MRDEIEIGAFDPSVDRVQIGFDKTLAIALRNRSDYQKARLAKEAAQIALFLAKNNQLWDVTLVAGVHANIGDTRDDRWAAGSGITRSTTHDDQLGWNIGSNSQCCSKTGVIRNKSHASIGDRGAIRSEDAKLIG